MDGRPGATSAYRWPIRLGRIVSNTGDLPSAIGSADEEANLTIKADTQLDLHLLAVKIGEGGMGVAWKAHDTSLDRDVAVKVLPEAFARPGEAPAIRARSRGHSGALEEEPIP